MGDDAAEGFQYTDSIAVEAGGEEETYDVITEVHESLFEVKAEDVAAYPTPHSLMNFGDDKIYEGGIVGQVPPSAPPAGAYGGAGIPAGAGSDEEIDAGAAAAGDVPAPPAAPPPPPRLDSPMSGGAVADFGDVLQELKQTVQETDGRWTASQAAAAYGDDAFLREQAGAQIDASQQAAAAAVDDQGRVTAEGYAAMVATGADASHAAIDMDTTRNRYQQTTGFDEAKAGEAAAAHQDIDAAAARALEFAQANPTLAGIGITQEESQAASDMREYYARQGDEAAFDPDFQAPGLSPDQQAALEQQRAQQQSYADATSYDYAAGVEAAASPDYQTVAPPPEMLQEQAAEQGRAAFAALEAEEQKLQESAAAALERAAERQAREN